MWGGIVAVAVVIAGHVSAVAQPMEDPMRPPGASAEDATKKEKDTSSSGNGLQVVITSPGRKLAVIDGAVVPLGAPVRDATLDGLSDSIAVLRKNGERDVLFMHPNVEKNPVNR